MNVLLKGVVGSTAYGLNHGGSDIDYMGIFAHDTEEMLGLNEPKDSVVIKDPDTTLHEAKKFVTLALNGNPSVSELLWLDVYEVMTDLGARLVNMRDLFLSAPRVRSAYLGYATSQFNRLLDRGDGTFSADTRKRTIMSPGTFADYEDMQQVPGGETPDRVRGQQEVCGRDQSQMQGLSAPDGQGRIRQEPGTVPGVGEQEEEASPGARRLGYAGETSRTSPEVDVRNHSGRGAASEGRAGRLVSDLWLPGGGGGSLSRNEQGQRTPLPEVQQGPGALRGQRNPAGSRTEVSAIQQGELSPERRRLARLEKHARHLVRLVEQGLQLYVTGELVVNLHSSTSEIDPEWIREMGREIAEDPAKAREYMVGAEKRFKRARTILPDQPSRNAVERWLIDVRREHWKSGPPLQ